MFDKIQKRDLDSLRPTTTAYYCQRPAYAGEITFDKNKLCGGDPARTINNGRITIPAIRS